MAHTWKYLYFSSTEQRLNKYSSYLQFFFRASRLLCSLCRAKQSHIFKFCEHLKASNAMTTRFGSRSSNSCYFHPQTASQTISEGLKSWGCMPLDSPSRRAYYALPSIASKCTLEPPFLKTLDPPLLWVYLAIAPTCAPSQCLHFASYFRSAFHSAFLRSGFHSCPSSDADSKNHPLNTE